ncbi:hypothetical protein [Natrinema sp. H-ect4]
MSRGVALTIRSWRGDSPLEQPSGGRNPEWRPSTIRRAEPEWVITS